MNSVLGVDTITIQEAVEEVIDYRGRTPPKTDAGVRLITAKVVKGGRILEEPKEFIAAELYDQWMSRGLPKELDVLLTTEAPLGEVAILRGQTKIALAQRIILLRANRSVVDPVFLYYALQSEVGQAELRARASGTTVSGIKQSELRQVRIPTLPLPVQRAAAAALNAYDELTECNERRIRVLEGMARLLFREWFVCYRYPEWEAECATSASTVPLPPVAWERRSLAECVDINPRLRVPRIGKMPFVPMAGLATDSMLITDVELREGGSGSKFQNGDTLFARITPCLENGKTGFVQFLPDGQEVALGSTEFIVMRSRTLSPEYVYLLARDNTFRSMAIKSMSGASGRQRVQEASLANFTIYQPPQDLLSRFTTIVRPMFKLIRQLQLQTENLRRTRDLLLTRLMSGQLTLPG